MKKFSRKKKLEKWSSILHIFSILLWRAEKKSRTLHNKLERTSYHSPSQNCPGRIFLFFFFFHSLPFNPSIFCEQRDLLFLWSRLYFRKNLPFFLFCSKKKTLSWKTFSFFLSSSVFCILCSSLFVFVHHVSHSPPFFVSIFAWSFVFLISFFLNSFFLYFTIFLNNNFSFLLYQKKYKY